MASDQLLAALQDDDVGMIGLYGMGGSGKTTLVTEVGKRAKELNIFDRVILTTVSQTLNIKKNQAEIADDLSLKLDEESEVGRAKRLSMRLSNGERILIILDDVWAKINLKDIGIPFEDYHVGCKVLLTTRLLPVCNLMDCEQKILLDLLSDEESWTLFQKHARIVDESLISVAKDIVRECKGLPIAIQAVGASLKGKSTEEWKEALGRLRDSKPIDVEPGVRDAISCLRLSYDYLRNNEAKTLFLLCCMYPEDEDISVEDLFRITIGLGMFDELGSLERARNKVSACINNLIDSCLLMRSDRVEGHLRMHDTVRDVALWISSQENCTIVVSLEKDLKVVADGLIKECYGLASWCNKKCQFPQRLDAPKLEILLLKNIGGREFSKANFEGMGALKVMEIVTIAYDTSVHLSLSCSINLLTNLRTLRLRWCRLDNDLSWILGLKSLEVLELKNISLDDLPQGLEELSKLKLLDICWIGEQSFKIIERCTQLEELYTHGIQLSRTTSELGKWFSNDSNFPRLKRFELKIGNSGYADSYNYPEGFHTKGLSLGDFKISTLSPFIKDLLSRAEVVSLFRFNGGCKNIVPDIVQVVGMMNELTRLELLSCSDLECVADATSHQICSFQVETLFFPNLIKLKLESSHNLKEIWHGPPLLCFFERLQELYISDCPMLTSLFPKCIVRAKLKLQKLTIKGCSELKNIIEEDGDVANNEISLASNNANSVFSKLKRLTIICCGKLEYVFSNSCVQGLELLEEVHIAQAFQLKYAFGQYEDERQEFQIKLPILKSLKLESLKNLHSVFPKNFHTNCPSLRELHWVECPKVKASCVNVTVGSSTNMLQGSQLYSRGLALLEELEVGSCGVEDILFAFEREDFTERSSQSTLISPLSTLKLTNLSELKFIWSGPMGMLSLQNLRGFTVGGCNNLRTIFSLVIIKRMPLLEYLAVYDCNELEEIMSGTEAGEQQGPLNSQSPQICFPNLKRLEVERCNKLKCLFSVAIDLNNLLEDLLPNLRSLSLEQVPNLKYFCQGLSLSNNCILQLLGSKLEALNLGSLPELWLIWRAPSHLSKLVCLLQLELSECNRLKSVFGEGFDGRNLPMLDHLFIRKCDELERIMTHANEFQPCFPKLEDFRVEHCNKLKCLFSTSSFTILLPRLNRMGISECAELEQLFVRRSEANNSDNNNVNEIVLPNLTYIWLKKLPSLVDICKGFKLPAVNVGSIKMKNCPKFSSIMGAIGSIDIDMWRQEAAEPDANSGNQMLHHDQFAYFFPRVLDLVGLKLQKLSEINFICKRFTCSQDMSFQNLQYLTVYGCGKVKCILSMSVWGSLPQLIRLDIIECEQLEEIMEEDLQGSNLPFPKLRWITVEGCHKLKFLFRTASVGMLLPKLSTIQVSEAAQMEELFSVTSHHQATDDANMQELVLPDLCTVVLSKLPALTHLCRGFDFNAPNLKDVRIIDCPKVDFSLPQATDEE